MKYLRVMKMALAFLLAMELAQIFSFQYAPSAGIVALLTIQNTKKETFLICIKRILSFFVSLFWGLIVFHVFGYHAVSFAIFLVFFIGSSYYFHLEDGIAMNAVLTTHFLIEQSMSLSWIKNEFAIFMIGIAIGIVMNLYMPSRRQAIRESMQMLDIQMKEMLMHMAQCLLKEKKTGLLNNQFDDINEIIERMLKQAYEQMNNQLLKDTKYEFEYLLMRKKQINVLKEIYNLILQINFTGKQAQLISQYFQKLSIEFHENNDVVQLQKLFETLQDYFDQDVLPQTRLEFENRAILFTMLTYIQKFLDFKIQFYQQR